MNSGNEDAVAINFGMSKLTKLLPSKSVSLSAIDSRYLANSSADSVLPIFVVRSNIFPVEVPVLPPGKNLPVSISAKRPPSFTEGAPFLCPLVRVCISGSSMWKSKVSDVGARPSKAEERVAPAASVGIS